ncbi:MAG: DinB family protein [Gemmatimonadales bacterium]
MHGKFQALASLAILVGSRAVLAQATNPLHDHSTAAVADAWIANVERELVPAADAMPAEKYGFAPATALGEFTGVRTFAQQVKHIAANNFQMASLIVGNPPTADMARETGPDSVRTKVQIMGYLRGSFAALHSAAATITDSNAVAEVKSPIAWQTTRLSFAIDAVAHSYDHYGQLVEYLRMNGVVPPASRRP